MKIFANFYEIHFIIIKIFSHFRTILNPIKIRWDVMTTSQNHQFKKYEDTLSTTRQKSLLITYI